MKTRLEQIRKQLGMRQDQIASVLDCTRSNIAMIECGKSSLSQRNKRILCKKFALNPLCFDNADAPMFLSEDDRLACIRENPLPIPGSVPLYDLRRIPSLSAFFLLTGKNKTRGSGRPRKDNKPLSPIGRITIPGAPECDGAVRIAGGGMEPALCRDDIVMYRQLTDPSEIFWGEMYLLSVRRSGDEYVAVRYLRRSQKPDMAVLAGENPDFGDTEVEISDITALALVKASIRMNSAK